MPNKNIKGFTIVELAIVMIIFGFVSSTMLLALRTYTEEARVSKTETAIQEANLSLVNFKSLNGRLPCPARLTDSPSDATYGYEVTAAATLANMQDEGQFDIDENGTTNNDFFVYGALPFNTILNTNNDPAITSIKDRIVDSIFSGTHSTDGWNNKVLYAVSRHLCEPLHPLADNPQGVIDVITEGTCTRASDGVIFPRSVLPGSCGGDDRRYAQFITLSHGENGRGAYDKNGNVAVDCRTATEIANDTMGVPPTGPNTAGDFTDGRASDKKNCRHNGADFNEGQFYSGLRTEAADNTYYDDYIKFYYEDNARFFSVTSPIIVNAGLPTQYEIPRIRNLNRGNIGIGLTDPEEAIHVDGDVQAFDIHAESFCQDIGSGECMAADILGGTGIECTNGAIKSIENNDVQCVDAFAGLSFTCGLDGGGNQMYLKNIRSDGTFDCVIP